MNGNTNIAYIYDTVSHEFDEQASYKTLSEFEDCWVFTSADLHISKYDTDYKDIMKLLIDKIKRSCIRTRYGYYVVSQDMLRDILENFYKEGINNE